MSEIILPLGMSGRGTILSQLNLAHPLNFIKTDRTYAKKSKVGAIHELPLP
jgi:hypothetical protein